MGGRVTRPVTRPVTRRVTRSRGRASLRRLARSERGAAVVEFAVVLPVLLILITGIIDFGRMYAVAASLAAAAHDGARMGAALADPRDAAQVAAVRARVVGLFQPMGGDPLTPAGVAVALDPTGTWVTVTVSNYTYRPVTPIAPLIGLGTVTLNRTASFRWERSP